MGQFIIKDGVLKKYAADPGDTEVVIPDSVTSIRRRAFEGCHSLTSITIPERVTRCVPDDMFYACPNIAVIKLHPDDPALRRYFSKYRCSIGTALHKASQYSTAPGLHEMYRHLFAILSYLRTHDEPPVHTSVNTSPPFSRKASPAAMLFL